MTIQEVINALSEYPPNFDLSEIKTTVGVDKEIGINRIRCVYLANKRIAGGHPWGPLTHMERQTDLNEVADSLLTGLKTSRLSEIMPYKEDGCYGGLPDNDTPLK